MSGPPGLRRLEESEAMTDTLSPPTSPDAPERPLRRSARPGLLRAGVPAAAWAAVAGFVTVAVPVLLVWAADSRSTAGAGAALRTVAQVWLLAHGAALHLPSGVVGLVPLGLLALPLLLLQRAARHAATTHAVTTLGDAARLACGVAGPYALALTVVAGLARGGGVRPDAVQALVGASLLGLLGAGTGVLRGSGLLPALRSAVPTRLRRAGPPAAAALLTLLGAGALLVAGSLALHLHRARELAGASSPGLVGGLGLMLVGLVLAPGAAVWGACWLAGPGFSVGAGTAVGPFAVHLGPVPAVPLLAALPAGPPPRALAVLALAVPVLAGVLAARLAGRRAGASWTDALLAGPLAGAVVALLAAVSAGPLGDGRLRTLGPAWERVGPAVAVEVLAGVLLAEAVRRLVRRVRRTPA